MQLRKLRFSHLEDRMLLAADLPELKIDDGTGFVVSVLSSEGGTSIYEVGDLNGDGLDDVGVAGLHYDNQEDVYISSLHILFGKAALPTSEAFGRDDFSERAFDIHALDGTNGFELVGYGGSFGRSFRSVAALGDVNGDGIDDLGLMRTAGGLVQSKSYVDILFGSTDPFDATLSQSDVDESGFTIVQSGVFGGGVRGIGGGDLNGDGIADVVVGGKFGMGVGVIYGSETLPNEFRFSDIGETNGFGFSPGDDNDYRYLEVADANGDGVGDLLIASETGSAANVVFGTRDLLPAMIGPEDLDGSNGFSILSAHPICSQLETSTQMVWKTLRSNPMSLIRAAKFSYSSVLANHFRNNLTSMTSRYRRVEA